MKDTAYPFLVLWVVLTLGGEATGESTSQPPPTKSPIRLALVGDPTWSAGTLRHAIQAIAAANGQAVELHEIPGKGRPLGEVIAGLATAEEGSSGERPRWDAAVVFDHPTRLLVQRRPGALGEEIAALKNLASRVVWVLPPAPRITAAAEAERLDLFKRAGRFPGVEPLSVVGAVHLIRQRAGAARWVADLSAERATSLGDYLMASLVCSMLWEVKQLPGEIPIGATASLKLPPEAVPLFGQLARQLRAGEIAWPDITWDYAPELAEPVQVHCQGGEVCVEDVGLVPSVFDWQGDGRPDLLVAARGTGECRLWTATGDGPLRFQLAREWKPGSTNCPWSTLVSKGVTVYQVLDFDRDRQPDFLLGTGTGELALVRGRSEGGFSAVEMLKSSGGEPLRIPYLVRVQLGVWGKEANWTLAAGNQAGEVVFFRQEGTLAAPTWSGPTSLKIGEWDFRAEGGAAPAFADWDRDGRTDLLIGTRSGSVLWVRNLGQEDQPAWDLPVTLVAPVLEESEALIPQRRKSGEELWLPTPGWSAQPVAADLSGDHLPDLLLGDVNRRVVKYRDLTAQEQAELQELLGRRKELLAKIEQAPTEKRPSLRAALWELTLAILEKPRDRRYERCGWLWYLERKAVAVPRP